MFIDSSYEGDLLARAGVSYTVGREDNNLYNETWNGVQMLDQHQFPDGVDPYVEKGNPESGLLWGISDAKLAEKGSGDKEVDVAEIQRMYQEGPLLDGSAPDILVDDVDIEPNEADGWHRIQAGNGYGRSYILLNPTRVNKRLRYPFEVKEDGRYTVYTYYIRRGESSKVTEIIVGNGKMEDRVKLDAGAITVKGQTSGEWVALGEYDFQAGDKCYVDFTNNGEVTGQICADAVLAVKKR